MTFARIAWPVCVVGVLLLLGRMLAYDIERTWKRQ